MRLKVTINQLRRWLEYCDEFTTSTNRQEFIDQAKSDKDQVRMMLRRGADQFKEILVFQYQRRMLVVDLDPDFLKRISEYIDIFIENCRLYIHIKEARMDKVRIAKLIRMFEPRNKELRRYFKLKVMDAA